jgi:hypothetical protein
MLLISTRVNDLPPKLFLIDTGAFSDTISPDAAREATKVRADTRIQVKGLNGAVKNVFTADDITLMFSHFRQPARDMVSFDTTAISNRTKYGGGTMRDRLGRLRRKRFERTCLAP